MKILLADDSKTNREILCASLMDLGHEVIAVNNGYQAIEAFQLNRPDLIILDVVMDMMDGFECSKNIRALDTEEWIPIIFLSAAVDEINVAKGIDAGGDDYLAKPVSDIILAAKIKAMERIANMRKKLCELTKKLNLLSTTDSLTGLNNRLQFDKHIKEKVSEADRTNKKMALLFIDLDKFKPINDTLGHHFGDLLLKQVTHRLKSSLREYDFVARIGGDEFAVVITNVESEFWAEKVAANLIHNLSQDFNVKDHVIHVGASIGIAIYPSEGMTKENWVHNADAAMYNAKTSNNQKWQIFNFSQRD